jgi:hypothetical protein
MHTLKAATIGEKIFIGASCNKLIGFCYKYISNALLCQVGERLPAFHGIIDFPRQATYFDGTHCCTQP